MKSRLIDANELIEWLTKPTGFRTNCEDCPTTGCIDCVIEEAIKNTPTAYDIDKVVEKIKEEGTGVVCGDGYGAEGRLETIIEIVKGGVE